MLLYIFFFNLKIICRPPRGRESLVLWDELVIFYTILEFSNFYFIVYNINAQRPYCIVGPLTGYPSIKDSTTRCMYVCSIEVALYGDAHGIGCSIWAKGRDPSGSWVQYPNPAGTIGPASLTLTGTSAPWRFPSQL